MDPAPIDRFAGEWAFLSNFHLSTVYIWGDLCPTVEHAYQAAKCIEPAEADEIRRALTPGRAKALGRRVKIRPDWDEIKVEIMRALIEQKFAPKSPGPGFTGLAAKLVATGDRPLIEGNHWGDRFWGMTRPTSNLHSGEWVGLNWLGELLMRQREVLNGK